MDEELWNRINVYLKRTPGVCNSVRGVTRCCVYALVLLSLRYRNCTWGEAARGAYGKAANMPRRSLRLQGRLSVSQGLVRRRRAGMRGHRQGPAHRRPR